MHSILQTIVHNANKVTSTLLDDDTIKDVVGQIAEELKPYALNPNQVAEVKQAVLTVLANNSIKVLPNHVFSRGQTKKEQESSILIKTFKFGRPDEMYQSGAKCIHATFCRNKNRDLLFYIYT